MTLQHLKLLWKNLYCIKHYIKVNWLETLGKCLIVFILSSILWGLSWFTPAPVHTGLGFQYHGQHHNKCTNGQPWDMTWLKKHHGNRDWSVRCIGDWLVHSSFFLFWSSIKLRKKKKKNTGCLAALDHLMFNKPLTQMFFSTTVYSIEIIKYALNGHFTVPWGTGGVVNGSVGPMTMPTC